MNLYVDVCVKTYLLNADVPSFPDTAKASSNVLMLAAVGVEEDKIL